MTADDAHGPPGEMTRADLEQTVRALLEPHPSVRRIELSGSRARGDATRWSDWDFEVSIDDLDALAPRLPSLIAPLEPLAWLWDPLANDATFMFLLDGPTKVDLIFDQPARRQPPYDVRAENLRAIDVHFWDWTLWLTSKFAAGKHDLVSDELEKMSWYILRPMGIEATPSDLVEAVDLYVAERTRKEQHFGVTVPRELGRQVEIVAREVA